VQKKKNVLRLNEITLCAMKLNPAFTQRSRISSIANGFIPLLNDEVPSEKGNFLEKQGFL